MAALLPTATLKAVLISPPAPASPFTIDPDRTQGLAPSGWPTATLKAVLIATPAPASPFTIDPNRTQDLAPNYGT